MSGALFGPASIEPQLGILIPVALISARLWRTLATAVVTIILLILVSSAGFGWSIWPVWLSQIPAHAAWAAGTKPQYMPTIVANPTFLGLDLPVARGIQLVVAIVIAGIIWLCFRRGVTNLGISALFVGTFLATPYAFFYDMPILTIAILAVMHDQAKTHRLLPIPDAMILGLALLLPALMMETRLFAPVTSIPLILLFGLIVRCIFGGLPVSARTGAVPPTERVGTR